MRVFLDANTLFCAADEHSATRCLLEGLLSRRAQVVTSPHAIEEARRNLAARRPQHLRGLDELQGKIETTHEFDVGIRANVPDEDKPIVIGAASSGCTHLWTSDKRHFGRYYGETAHGLTIVSSIILADLLAGRK